MGGTATHARIGFHTDKSGQIHFYIPAGVIVIVGLTLVWSGSAVKSASSCTHKETEGRMHSL